MGNELLNGVQIKVAMMLKRRLQSAQRANAPMPTADELARDIYRELDPNEETPQPIRDLALNHLRQFADEMLRGEPKQKSLELLRNMPGGRKPEPRISDIRRNGYWGAVTRRPRTKVFPVRTGSPLVSSAMPCAVRWASTGPTTTATGFTTPTVISPPN